MKVLPFGEEALLLEYSGLAEVIAAAASLRASPAPGIVDVVPAARTVLVRFDATVTTRSDVERWVGAASTTAPPAPSTAVVRIPVRYDGPDLEAVAETLSLSVADLIAWHTGRLWTSAFIGFAPGFAYLSSSEPGFAIPRRSTSRAVVPAGSVALADDFTGVYPRSSPGGWQLVGTTDALLWNERRPQPALLPPGTRVRFEAVG
jgi:KipI family sensor histidine kinase inhibitor